MQPVQGYLCMMVLLQGVGCNLCFVCVSFFIVFKSIKRSMHNVGCIGCVTISTRTGVYEFRSVTCIKGYVFYCKPLISYSVRELGISVFISHCYGPAHRLFVVSQIFFTIFEITESICV